MNHNEENQSTEVDRSPLTFTDLKRWLGLLVLLISAALLAWALKSILLLFAVVFLVAMVLNPIVAFLQRRRIHRGLAVALLPSRPRTNSFVLNSRGVEHVFLFTRKNGVPPVKE